MESNIIICSTELSKKEGKNPLFPHILKNYLDKQRIPYLSISLVNTGGDYIVQNIRLVIERKTVADLIHTWIGGSEKGKKRLDEQMDKLERILETYENCKVVLLIEDYYKCIFDYADKCVWTPIYEYPKGDNVKTVGYHKTRINPKSLKGKLRAIKRKIEEAKTNGTAFSRLEVVKCAGGYHALEWFLEQLNGKKETRQETIEIHRVKQVAKSDDLREKQLFLIEGLPEVGGKTSQRLLDFYKSPLEAFLHIKEWKEHEELGKITKPMVEKGCRVLGVTSDEEKDSS